MTLHLPRLPPEARPPLGFPPIYRARKDVRWLLVLLAFALTASWFLGLPCLALPAFATLGFCYVSAALGRRKWWHSRYCTEQQLVRLILLSIAAHFLLGAGHPFAKSAPLAASWGWTMGFFVALHLCFADGSAFLQTFGLRWSDTRRWNECSRAELLLSFAIATGTLGLLCTSALSLLIVAPQSDLLIALGKTAAMIVLIALVTAIKRRSHDLHPHHYLIGLLLLPVASAAAAAAAAAAATTSSGADDTHTSLLPRLIAALVSALPCFGEGLSFGLVVEGAATWGLDPILIRRRTENATLGGEDNEAAVEVDWPTYFWCSTVAALSSGNPAASDALAFLIVRLLRAGEHALLDKDAASANAGLVASLLMPWLRNRPENLALTAGCRSATDSGSKLEAREALSILYQRPEMPDATVPATTDPAKGISRRSRSRSRSRSKGRPHSASASGKDADNAGKRTTRGNEALAAFKARVDALAARIQNLPKSHHPAAAFALLNALIGGINAGSVEITQTLALQRQQAQGEKKAEGAAAQIVEAVITTIGGYRGREESSSRERFDDCHEDWRKRRDAAMEVLNRMTAPSSSPSLVSLSEDLQGEIARLADEASQCR